MPSSPLELPNGNFSKCESWSNAPTPSRFRTWRAEREPLFISQTIRGAATSVRAPSPGRTQIRDRTPGIFTESDTHGPTPNVVMAGFIDTPRVGAYVAVSGRGARTAARSCANVREETACEGDEKTGIQILKRELEAPARQIAENSAVDGGVVVARMLASQGNFGFDAARKEHVDLVEAGIVDPAKVVRTALEKCGFCGQCATA